jgi:hypothetical protein
VRGLDDAVRIDREDFDAAVDVAHVEAAAVGGEDEPGVAQLAFLVRIEDLGRHDSGVLLLLALGWELDLLEDAARRGLDDDDFVRLAGDDEDLPVGRQGQVLGPEPGQSEVEADRGHDLVDREDGPALPFGPDGLPVLGVFRSPARGGGGEDQDERDGGRAEGGAQGPIGHGGLLFDQALSHHPGGDREDDGRQDG